MQRINLFVKSYTCDIWHYFFLLFYITEGEARQIMSNYTSGRFSAGIYTVGANYSDGIKDH